MQSWKACAGALLLLVGVVLAIVFGSAFENGAEIIIHVALGTSFLLFSFSAFDFRTPSLVRWIAFAAIGTLAIIFLLQGAGDALQSAPLRRLAYEELGQRLEKVLGYAFLLWCAVLLALHSRGWRRVLGAVLLALVIGVEVYSFSVTQTGSEAPGALKLLYLPLFAWLLLEGLKRREV